MTTFYNKFYTLSTNNFIFVGYKSPFKNICERVRYHREGKYGNNCEKVFHFEPHLKLSTLTRKIIRLWWWCVKGFYLYCREYKRTHRPGFVAVIYEGADCFAIENFYAQ